MSKTDVLNLKLNRKGFGTRAKVREWVKDTYQSGLISQIKEAEYTAQFGRLTLHLAKEFGFCYGVDRAIEMAYETCDTFPNKNIYLTTEIIHNPTVNGDLLKRGVKFLSGPYKNAQASDVTAQDVVIIPAFGTTVTEIRSLYDTGATLVDTICGSVVNVWKRVEKYAQEGFTSLIHGKYNHEETMATSSRVLEFDQGHFLIVLNEEEAQKVCDYIENPTDKSKFLETFKKVTSVGFDPDLHLVKIGCANQTTMLSSESLRIAQKIQASLKKRYGAENINHHFRTFDTICSATQERQDAIIALKEKKPDLVLVVGGFNSSNTTHLHEMALTYAASFHIDNADCIRDDLMLKHKPFGKKEILYAKDWLPKGEISVGISSGASTPDKVLEEVIQKVVALSALHLPSP